jgi:hypothetical protein
MGRATVLPLSSTSGIIIQDTDMTHTPATDIFRCQQSHSDDNQIITMLSDVYVQKLIAPMTSKMYTYASQPIAMSPSTHTLKS